jgi:hypothetical protein
MIVLTSWEVTSKVDRDMSDYFISDEDALEDDDILSGPVVVPVAAAPVVAPVQAPAGVQPVPVAAPAPVSPAAAAVSPDIASVTPVVRPAATVRPATREELLASTLDDLLKNDDDIQAAALVSLDGFTMAAALPDGMQADRVGAMSAAILGLGERAAAELGRGHLSQVFIEGEGGYVMLVAAGPRAVLTVMAAPTAKLGLVLYDMKDTAARVSEILR